MTRLRIRLDCHRNWRVGEPIPTRDALMKYVVIAPQHQGGHWVQQPWGRRRWNSLSNDQAQVRFGNATINVARALIAHTFHDGKQPPLYVNNCQFTECVNPVHWTMVRRTVAVKLPRLLEARGSSIVVTHGGHRLKKDAVVTVAKHDGPIHVLRVLVNPDGQLLQVLCGAQLDLEYLVVEDKATCAKCLQ